MSKLYQKINGSAVPLSGGVGVINNLNSTSITDALSANMGKELRDTTYTKTESDGLLDDKADKSTTYTKTEVDALIPDISGKADKSTTYTKTETDALLDDKVDDADIVTSFNATLSDEKIPSEKLVKNNLDSKVDKETGKGLSTNDYTTTEKNKLAGIATGATKVTVDSALSSTSTNAIQNKVVNTALAGKASTSVATSSTNGLMSKEDKIKLDSITIVIS